MPMTVYEAITLMLLFGSLIVGMISLIVAVIAILKDK
jgi:hypothetical protein